MNLFQRINVTSTFAVLSANAFGLVHPLPQNLSPYEFGITHIDVLSVMTFSILLRVKTCFDDNYYFKMQHNGPRDYCTLIGFLISLFAWTTWIISGSLSYNPRNSASWLAVTIILLTVWLLFHLLELWIYPSTVSPDPSPSIRARAFWVVLNVLYIVLLAMFGSSRTDAAFGGDGTVLTALFVVLAIDFALSGKWIARAGHET
jgi:hypothetical protein